MNLIAIPMTKWPVIYQILSGKIDQCHSITEANLKLYGFLPLTGYYAAINQHEDKLYLSVYVEIDLASVIG